MAAISSSNFGTPPPANHGVKRKFESPKSDTPSKVAEISKKLRYIKPTSYEENGVTYQLVELLGGTAMDVFRMDKNGPQGVLKKPKLEHREQFKKIQEQYNAIKDIIPVAKTAFQTGQYVQEYFPKILSEQIKLTQDGEINQEQQNLLVGYGQFLRKVLVHNIDNLDVKPNNIGIRENGEMALFDLDGEMDEDDTLSRFTQGITNICNNNSSAAATIKNQLNGLTGERVNDIRAHLDSVKPFEVILPLFATDEV